MGSKYGASSSCINSSRYGIAGQSTPSLGTANLSSHPLINGFAPLKEKKAKEGTVSLAEEAIIGNVHSGAPPPWLDAFEQNQMDSLSKSGQNGLDSLCQKSKCSKLNPKRVGAAWAEKRKLEMELEKKGELVMKNADANWLPNFGRVWQTGSRKESRKEFQIEKKLSGKIESQSSSVIQLQPYISKRMRKDLVDIPEQPSSPE
ncbi:unnamed protein product [Cuscuta epithymum]|nr:unnamed protein product [Cuscuta epithymum]